MGAAMARNLLRAGHQVTAYNRTRDKAAALEADGARVADSPGSAVRDCQIAITMLADDAAVEQTVGGPDGIAANLPARAVHLSASTISTALARRLASVHDEHGQGYLSTPVFGRPEAAESRKLLVVAGGAADLIESCRPVFEAIGRETFVAGPEPWQANAVKLCGNFLLASMLESFGEAYATLRKAGVEPHLFLNTMNALFASPVYANYGRLVADQQYEPAGFALRLGLKDARLVVETALECASPMPIASLVRDRLLAGVAQGQGDLDWSSVARVSARNAGLPG